MNARTTLITVMLALALLVPAAASADVSWPYPAWQPSWGGFFRVTDTSGNPLVGPGVRMFDDTPEWTNWGTEFRYSGIQGGQDLYTAGSGITVFFLGFERDCIPNLPDYGFYPLNMANPVLNGYPNDLQDGAPLSNCWQFFMSPNNVRDGEQLRVLADASWTDGGGTTWVFDHWVLENVKTGCTQGATSAECSFTTLALTPYAFHALYRQQPTVPAYTVSPFAQPVDNLPTLNVANAGSSIPLKFTVTDATGAPVTNLTASDVSVTSAQGGDGCGTGAGSDAIEQYTGLSGLQNLGGGAYQYNWKTPKTYKGQCRTMTVSFASGTGSESAGFSFK